MRGLGGDDVFASDDNSARTTLDGGIGDDTFQFGQLYGTQRNSAAAPAGGDLATGDIFGTIATTRGWLSAGVSRATAAVGGEGDDVFAVYANEALLTLLGGAGDDLFTLRAFALAETTGDCTPDAVSPTCRIVFRADAPGVPMASTFGFVTSGGTCQSIVAAVGAASFASSAASRAAPVGTDSVTVPATDPVTAHRIVTESGCTTAKVKVAERGQYLAEDVARLEAVRDALGPSGRLRIDANGAWSVPDALSRLQLLARFDLEYVEQPCASIEELARLRRELARRGMSVPIAADESIRRSGDPERVAALEAADVAVLKVQPLGGVRRCLELAETLGLPVVVSSALESSVGLRAGVALAAALPDLPYACGLNTAAMFTADVTAEPLLATGGTLAVRDVEVDENGSWQADPETAGWWRRRWEDLPVSVRSPG